MVAASQSHWDATSSPKDKEQKLGVNKKARSIETAKIGVQNWKSVGKNRCKSTRMSTIWEKMGNLTPFERVMGPNRHNMENYGDLQPIARSMKPTLWVLSKNLSFGLLPYKLKSKMHYNILSQCRLDRALI